MTAGRTSESALNSRTKDGAPTSMLNARIEPLRHSLALASRNVVGSSISSGSGDSLKISLRWGRNPKARQMRLTVMRLRPVAGASERVLQCVAPGGVVSNVVMTTCPIWASVTVRGVPGRGSSSNPSIRSRAKRVRH